MSFKERKKALDQIENYCSNLLKYMKMRKEPYKFNHESISSSSSKRKFRRISRNQKRIDEEISESKGSRSSFNQNSNSKRKSAQNEVEKELDKSLLLNDTIIYQPSLLKNCILKDYQIEGLNWMIDLHTSKANGILADSMGLGKTVQTIAFLAYLEEIHHKKGPHLVVCPLTVTNNWKNELGRFYPSAKVCLLSAKSEQRVEDVKEIKREKPNVVVCSYQAVEANLRELRKIELSYVFIDEGHRMKNTESQFYQAMESLDYEGKMIITGTPLSNNIVELYALLHFLMPQLFKDDRVFKGLFTLKGYKVTIPKEEEESIVKSLHKILEPFMLRRLKQDTNLNLPPKKEIVLTCPLTKLQVEVFKALMSDSVRTREITSGSRVTDLRQAAIHPYLFEGFETDTSVFGEHLMENSGKFIILDKLIKRYCDNRGRKMLIFSQFTSVLNILQDFLVTRDIGYFRLDGSTTLEERYEQMNEFNSDQQDKKIFMLSTRAGGLGINLVAANIVVFLDSDWNPQMDMQAMDRAHRIGQKNEVLVFRLISKNTIEERILECQKMKIKMDFQFIERGRGKLGKLKPQVDSDSFNLKKLSERDMNDLAFFGASNILKASEKIESEDGGDNDQKILDMDIDKLIEECEATTEKKNDELERKVKEFTENAM